MEMINPRELKNLLDEQYLRYNDRQFIATDPIYIPHRYSSLQDKEISGLFAAIFAWGQRTTIIVKADELMRGMDHRPYDFIRSHSPRDLRIFNQFRHRTFNGEDARYFIRFLHWYYSSHDSLEKAFVPLPGEIDTGPALQRFYTLFFHLPEAPSRTHKHIATPAKNSACKRLNMYLRWMVRHDQHGVDLGLWKTIDTAKLICPLDIHTMRSARTLGLLSRPIADWLAAKELTEKLKIFDPHDPVKYDFALFGMSVEMGRKTDIQSL